MRITSSEITPKLLKNLIASKRSVLMSLYDNLLCQSNCNLKGFFRCKEPSNYGKGVFSGVFFSMIVVKESEPIDFTVMLLSVSL